MTANPLAFRDDLKHAPQNVKGRGNYQWEVAMSIDIRADTRRIFNALSYPEYQELWMRIPGQQANCCVMASRVGSSFRLDYFKHGDVNMSIGGIFQTCRFRKIVFSWWRWSPGSLASSVSLCLDGNFGSSTLRLKHTGLTTRDEYIWQKEMWRGSLAKLRDIFSSDERSMHRRRCEE